MRIVLLGAPGSGKGTQAGVLRSRYEVPHISTGDLLREAVAAQTVLGKRARPIMEAGELVPDEIVIGLIEERLRSADARRGFILDGFPRNIPQAQELDRRLALLSRPLQIALYLEVGQGILMKRLTGRLTCGSCGTIYNRFFSPPRKRGVCDACGARKLVHRSDDNEKTVSSRLDTFTDQTRPLIEYYRAQHKLRTVSAEGDPEEIRQRIIDIVNSEIRPLEGKFLELAGERELRTPPPTVIAGGAVVKIAATTAAGAVTRSRKKPATKAKKSPGRKAVAPTSAPAKSKAAKRSAKSAVKKAAAKKKARKAVSKVAKKSAKKATRKSEPRKKTAAVSRKRAPATRKAVAGAKATARKKAAKKVARKKPSSTNARASKKRAVAKKKVKKVVKKAVRKVAAGRRAGSRAAPSAKKKVAKRTAARGSGRGKKAVKKRTARRR